MHDWLLSLGLVNPPTRLEFYSERSAVRATTKPGYDYERDFEYGVKENGQVALQIAWTQYLAGDGRPDPDNPPTT